MLVSVFCAVAVHAVDPVTFEGVVYTPDPVTMTCELTDGTQPYFEYVNIPETVEGYTVTSIAADAFQNADVAGITMPNTVTSIGDGAFSGSLIEEITLSENLKTIPNSTFSDCIRLSRVVIPEGVESLGESVFSGCDGLGCIILPSTLKSMGIDCFNDMMMNTSPAYAFKRILECRAVVPPAIEGYYGPYFLYIDKILVPRESLDAYKIADGWAEYPEKIKVNGVEILSDYSKFYYVKDAPGALPVSLYKDGEMMYYDLLLQEDATVTSSNPSVATAQFFESAEFPLALAPTGAGTATITVDCQGVSRSFDVTVWDVDIKLMPYSTGNPSMGYGSDGIVVGVDESVSLWFETYVSDGSSDAPVMGVGSGQWNMQYMIDQSRPSSEVPYEIVYSPDESYSSNSVVIRGLKPSSPGSGLFDLVISAKFSPMSTGLEEESQIYYCDNMYASARFPVTVIGKSEQPGLSLILPNGRIYIPDAASRETTLHLIPDEGWEVNSAMLDGWQDVPEEWKLSGEDNAYVVPALSEHRTLSVVFGRKSTMVDEMTAMTPDIMVRVWKGEIKITGASDGAEVVVYDVDGRCLMTTTDHHFSMSGTGVRVLTVDGRSYKFVL